MPCRRLLNMHDVIFLFNCVVPSNGIEPVKLYVQMHFDIYCRHNYNHLYSVRNVVLATLLQCYQPYSGSIVSILFLLMCMA